MSTSKGGDVQISVSRAGCMLFVLFSGMLGCAPVTDSESARQRIAASAVLRIEPPDAGDTKTLFKLGVLQGLFGGTEVVPAQQGCQGAAGSVIPPLTAGECTPAVALLPVKFALSVLSTITGSPGSADGSNASIGFSDPGRFWVHQIDKNDCWAATLEMARKIHGFTPIPQRKLLADARAVCPAFPQNTNSADAFQIIYVVKEIWQSNDRTRTQPDVCSNAKCIVNSLQNSHPIIMLKHEHATLIVGADYMYDSRYPDTYIITTLHILDPATSPTAPNKETTVPFLDICGADMFIAY